MNINKHDSETEMEMNMTPMIDVVFLLIIFFMIITDLSQQELEELELPQATVAVEDKPDPEANRPILNILQDGTVIVKREVIYDPELDDYTLIQEYLAKKAAQMEKETLDNGLVVPSEALLIRADENSPFKMIQKVMALCGLKGIQIWKVELAASIPEDAKPPQP